MPRRNQDKSKPGKTQPEKSLDFKLAEFVAGRDAGALGDWAEASFVWEGSRAAAPLASAGAADGGEAA